MYLGTLHNPETVLRRKDYRFKKLTIINVKCQMKGIYYSNLQQLEVSLTNIPCASNDLSRPCAEMKLRNLSSMPA